MRLFSHAGTCSSAVHIALLEAGVEFELVQLDVFGDKRLPDGSGLLALNPKGTVPTMQLDDGTVLTETTVLLQFIADTNAPSDLAPDASTFERVRFNETLSFLSDLHKSMGLFYNPELTGGMRAYSHEVLHRKLALIDGQLSAQSYIAGDRFTVADAYLYIILTWADDVGQDLNPYRHLIHYRNRVGSRPSVRCALGEKAN